MNDTLKYYSLLVNSNMILTSIKVHTDVREYVLDNLRPVTILTSTTPSGKSTLLRVLYDFLVSVDRIFAPIQNVDRVDISLKIPDEATEKLRKKYSRKWDVELEDWDGNVKIVKNFQHNHKEFILYVDNEIVFHAVQRLSEDEVITSIRRPVSIDLKTDTDSIGELYHIICKTPQAQLFSEYEELLLLGSEFCKDVLQYLKDNVKVYLIGPYIDYGTCADPVSIADEHYVGRHGENTILVLASLFTDGRVWPELAQLISTLEKMGIKRLRCGYRSGKIALSCLTKHNELVVCPELPCSVKVLITYYTQLLALPKYSIVLIDNFDYCMYGDTCQAIAKFIRNVVTRKKCQLIVELHNKDLVKCLVSEYSVLVTI